MEDLLGSFLKANVVFTVLFAAYFMVREEKFPVVNRFILLAVLLTAVAVPFGPNFPLNSKEINDGVMTSLPSMNALWELNKEKSSASPDWIENREFIS
jgi:hypothetical protein